MHLPRVLRRTSGLTALLFFPLGMIPVAAGAQPRFQVRVSDRPPIEGFFRLVSSSPRPAQVLPTQTEISSTYTVRLAEATIRPGESMKMLLRRNGIFPDANAYALVYEANPFLGSVDSIQAGASILLPKLSPDLVLAEPTTVLAVLDLHAELKAELESIAGATALEIADLLTDLGFAASQLPAEDPLIGALQDLHQKLRALDAHHSTAGRNTLTHLIFELRYLGDLLNGRDRSAGTLANIPERGDPASPLHRRPHLAQNLRTETEERRIRELAEAARRDVNTFERCVRSGTSCEVTVLVNTVSRTGAPRNGLQVLAAPALFADDPTCRSDPMCLRMFRRLSSPAVHELPTGTPFAVWVEENDQPISRRKTYIPRRGVQNEMDIQIQQ